MVGQAGQATRSTTEQSTGVELVETMRHEIERYTAKRLNHADADEVVGDVVIATHRAIARGDEVTPGWIMRVTRNKVVDRWRSNSRRDRLRERLVVNERLETAREPVRITVEADSRVGRAIGALPERYQLLLVRHYLDGEPIGAIATSVGASYSATESALARARRAFRSQYVAIA